MLPQTPLPPLRTAFACSRKLKAYLFARTSAAVDRTLVRTHLFTNKYIFSQAIMRSDAKSSTTIQAWTELSCQTKRTATFLRRASAIWWIYQITTAFFRSTERRSSVLCCTWREWILCLTAPSISRTCTKNGWTYNVSQNKCVCVIRRIDPYAFWAKPPLIVPLPLFISPVSSVSEECDLNLPIFRAKHGIKMQKNLGWKPIFRHKKNNQRTQRKKYLDIPCLTKSCSHRKLSRQRQGTRRGGTRNFLQWRRLGRVQILPEIVWKDRISALH